MNTHKNILLAFIILVVIAISISFFSFFSKSISNELSAPKKVYRVGILNGFDYIKGNADGFIAGMADLGYIEGKNITYDVRSTGVDKEVYRKVLKEFADNKVDLIYTFPTQAAVEAKQISKESGIPLVFAHSNFEGMNLIDSIESPGNNLTGVRFPGPAVALKRLEVLLEIYPNVKNIAIPYLKGFPNVFPQMNMLNEHGPELGVNIIELPAATPDELQTGLDSLSQAGTLDAIMTIAEPVSGLPAFASVYAGFAYKNNIPVGGTLLLKENGYEYETIFGADANTFTSGEKASVMADKVFKGIDPGTIPVESAEIYLELNYRHAQDLGVELDEGLLSTADNIVR